MEGNTRYVVSARKYRPSSFGSVVGQDSLTTTLKNAVSSGRLAQAYLFCGPRGVGKTSCARIFAKRINCLNPTADGEACGECESCRSIEEGNSFNIIELDAASNNSVDDIRSLTEQVNIPPQVGKYRVFIIDEVHMLTSAAFNAFLKTLEEPPSYVVFILATTEKHKVIPTILSRCQIYDFRRIGVDDMTRHLAYVAQSEGVAATEDALSIIAQKADGAMRDALSIFDQVAASCDGNVTYEKTIASLNVLDYGYYFRLTDAFRTGNVADALLIYKEIRDAGFDSLFFVNGLASHVRDLMVASDASTVKLLEVGSEIGKRYTQLAQQMPLAWYYNAMRVLNDTDLNYRTSGNKQLLVELALIRLCGQGGGDGGSKEKLNIPQRGAQSSNSNPSAGSTSSSSPSTGESTTVQTGSSGSQTHVSQQNAVGNNGVKVATPRPVSAPRAGVAPRAPRVAAGASSLHSFRLKQNSESGEGGASDSQPPSAVRRENQFTDDAFFRAWRQFMTDHKDKILLVSAMRSGQVRRLSATDFAIEVANLAQVSAYESDLKVLSGYMRDQLQNDLITVTTVQGEVQARQRRLAPIEIFKKAVNENPVLAELMRETDAELT